MDYHSKSIGAYGRSQNFWGKSVKKLPNDEYIIKSCFESWICFRFHKT